jgi:hypothetical protein
MDAEPDELPPALAPFQGDLSVFRAEHWQPMKVWLPDPADHILKQMADDGFVSRSGLIRNALFVYVYGQYALAQMRAEKDGFFFDSGARFSRTVSRTQALGKNIRNYKVFIPARLRDDLESLAADHRLTLSHFTREVLISAFMGHRTLPERQAALDEAHQQPAVWPPEPVRLESEETAPEE